VKNILSLNALVTIDNKKEERCMQRIPEGTVRSIKDWQKLITDWAIKKGFRWTKKDADTMLLRIHSEVSEASEAIRDNDFAGFAEELADIFIRLVNLSYCFVYFSIVSFNSASFLSLIMHPFMKGTQRTVQVHLSSKPIRRLRGTLTKIFLRPIL